MRFLELSLGTPDIRASLAFYSELGFTTADVGDAWHHPYAVVTDGRLWLGLHEEAEFVNSTTFVKPGLLAQLHDLEKLGIELDFAHLGDDVFNEVGWHDPAGNMIRLVEARTFSPAPPVAGMGSLCGYFVEIGLPAADREVAKEHWEQFGFVGIEEPDAALPHVSCTSDGVDIGLYDPVHIGAPSLLFEVDDCAATLERLGAAGISPSGRLPGPLKQRQAAQLRSPEGTLILLLHSGI